MNDLWNSYSRQQLTARTTGVAVWFTGLSGSGKTTLCNAVSLPLTARGFRIEILDGDEVRKSLNKELGFSKADRDENVRRIGLVAELLVRNGIIVLIAAISPYRTIREEIREKIGRFIEVHVHAPLEICEQRDPKGLYRRARRGELIGFTGIDDPYEIPLAPEVRCETDRESVQVCTAKVIASVTEFLDLPVQQAATNIPTESGVKENLWPSI